MYWDYKSYLVSLYFVVQSVIVVAVSASYYQKEISGYLFTTFSYNGEWRNQADAQYWCNQNGSKLLAVTNAGIQDAVVAFINEAIQQGQLTGNNTNVITDGKRTTDDWRWINGTSSSPLSIGGQESNTRYSLSYGYLYRTSTDFTLAAAQPTDKNFYICEFAGQTACVNGYQYGSQCFQSFNEYVTWFEARNRCLLRGGDLATFEFITTNDGLNSLNGSWINPTTTTKYWIGLRRQWWTWQSINSDVTYSQWVDGEPVYYQNDNIDCLCLRSDDWKWGICRCSDTAQIVCIKATSSSSGAVSATPLASLSTSNPLRSASNAVSILSGSTSTTTAQYSNLNALNASQDEEQRTSAKVSNKDLALAIGLGVGLGVGLLVAVLIVVLILLSRKGHIRKNGLKLSGNKTESSLPSVYESLQNRSTTTENNSTYQGLNIAQSAGQRNIAANGDRLKPI